MTLEGLTDEETTRLIEDIATRAGTTLELCEWWDCSKEDLKAFVQSNRLTIELARQESDDESTSDSLSPTQLGDLWITQKFERLLRLQTVADWAYAAIEAGSYADATLLREFRSYLTLAANELGQLLHRGAGDASDGDTVAYTFEGIDLDNLR